MPTENFVPGRSHNLKSILLQLSLGITLLAIVPFAPSALGQSELNNAVAANGETTVREKPARVAVATEGRPSKGPEDAPVTIVGFSDFQCPYCASLFSTLKAIEKNYQDKVRIVYLQFPLRTIHPNAQKAAEASLCANEQNQFWPMLDAMFADQRKLSVDELKRTAEKLSLDMSAFNACLDGNKYDSAIRADIAEGLKVGVRGTPAFFVNERFFGGSVPYDEIQRAIEDELQRTSAKQ